MASVTENINFNVNTGTIEENFKRLLKLCTDVDNAMQSLESQFSKLGSSDSEGLKRFGDSLKSVGPMLNEIINLVESNNFDLTKSFNINTFNAELKDTQSRIISMFDEYNKLRAYNVRQNVQSITSSQSQTVSSSNSQNDMRLRIEQALLEMDKQLTNEQRARIELARQNISIEAERARALEAEKASNAALTESLTSRINKLKEDTNSLGERFKTIFSSGDMSGLSQATSDMRSLNESANELRTELSDLGSREIGISSLDEQLSSVQSQLYGISTETSSRLRNDLTNNLKSVVNTVGNLSKKAINNTLSLAKSAVKTFANLFKSTIVALGNLLKNKIKDALTFNIDLSGVVNQLEKLVGITSLSDLSKQSIDFASSLIEVQNVVDNVFKSMSGEIDDFTANYVDKFGLTTLKAKEIVSVYGGILKASNLPLDTVVEMSKNLTALTGDVASMFEHKFTVDEVFTKLQSGIVGYSRALTAFGINMTVANLNAYALSKGIEKTYDKMTQAEKTTLRYNYILEKFSDSLGDFSRTQASWANQVRILSANFKQLLSILGGGLIKLLYPVVKLLNQIVVAAINAANAIATLFGFEGKDLSDMFGGTGGVTLPDTGDYADGLEDVADATDDVAKSTKNANDNLQTFDKLNNIKTPSSSKDGLSGADLGGLLDFSSYYKEIPDLVENGSKLTEWLDELIKKLSEHDFAGAGKQISDAINDMLTSINKYLKENTPLIQNKMHEFNDGLTDFIDTLLDADFYTIGENIGLGLNLITYYFNDLYNQLESKGILSKIGVKIADFFNGLSESVNWKDLGSMMVLGVKSVFKILESFLSNAKPEQYGINFKDFLLGAIDRLFSDGGAEEIGNTLAGVVNFAFDFLIGAFGDLSVVNELSNSIVTVINTAIRSIDENKLSTAVSVLLRNLARLLTNFSNINFDEFGEKLAKSINDSIKNHSVEDFAKGLTDLVLSIISFLISFISTLDWFDLANAILSGIGDAIKDNPESSKAIGNALATVFGLSMLSGSMSLAIKGIGFGIIQSIAGGISGTASVSAISNGFAITLKGVLSNAAFIAALGGVSAAIYEAVGKPAKELADSYKESSKEFRDAWERNDVLLKRLKESSEQTFYATNLIDYATSIKNVSDSYNNLDESVRTFIETGENFNLFSGQFVHLKDMREAALNYAQSLRDAGYENENLIKSLENLANTKVTPDLNGAELKQKIADLMRDIEMQIQTESATISSLTESEMNEINNNLLSQAKESGFRVTRVFSEGIQGNRGSVVTATTDVENDIYNKFSSIVTRSNQFGADTVIGYSNSMSINTPLVSEASNNIYNATVGTFEGLDASMSSIAQSGVSSYSGTIGSGASISQASLSINSLITKSAISGKSIANSNGKYIGSNTVYGIVDGVKDADANSNLSNSISDIASFILNKFKSALGIASPSKEFAKLSKFIPEGVAVGIEDNEDTAITAVSRFSDDLMSMFDIESVDLSEMIDISKFSDLFKSVGSETDSFVSNISNKLSSIKMSGIDSGLEFTPKMYQMDISRVLEQSQSNDKVISGLGNIYSKLGGISRQTGKNLQVNVYLDANNKLGDFVIDTINGQVLKGGNF